MVVLVTLDKVEHQVPDVEGPASHTASSAADSGFFLYRRLRHLPLVPLFGSTGWEILHEGVVPVQVLDGEGVVRTWPQ